MLLVDCPLCATPAPFGDEDDALDCSVCDIRLELAPDDLPMVFAAAA